MLIGGEGAAIKAIQKGATVAMVKELFVPVPKDVWSRRIAAAFGGDQEAQPQTGGVEPTAYWRRTCERGLRRGGLRGEVG